MTSEFLLEIFSEEIPARMQGKAASDLGRLLSKALREAGFEFDDIRTFAGPRRLTLVIADLPAKSPDVTEIRKGPRVGAPEQAMAGFMRGAGVSSLDDCEQHEDKKGTFWVAKLEKPGRVVAEVLAEAIPQIMADFAWPKSMKWGTGSFRWVRPLHGIVCLLDGKVVPFDVAGVQSGNQTFGHRIMGPGPYTVSSFADYRKQLEGPGHVLLDVQDRKARISSQIADITDQNGLALVEDTALLDEVAGLAEWPVTLLGDMDKAFLDLPPEVITLSMAKHQKYFSVNNAKTGKLAPNFLVVANLEAPDGGKAISLGNARVLTARLADARHFWDMDRAQKLDSRVEALRDVVFHQKLGSIYDKAERVAALAKELAPIVGADPDLAERAAWLAKADLITQMVIEFTSLQGVMGRYYALADGRCFEGAEAPPQHEDINKTKNQPHPEVRPQGASKDQPLDEFSRSEVTQIADAIRDHYKPQGPTDMVPTDPVSVAVALADKLNTLVGFWAINEKPTGSKDPYALRRAALGVIRIVLENGVRLDLVDFVKIAFSGQIPILKQRQIRIEGGLTNLENLQSFAKNILKVQPLGEVTFKKGILKGSYPEEIALAYIQVFLVVDNRLLTFFHDRLKVHLREQGIRHDLIDAVLTPDADDLVAIVARVQALSSFLETQDGTQLLAGTKQAVNILKAEEKKQKETITGEVDNTLLREPEELALHAALQTAAAKSAKAIKAEDYTAAMTALATLRAPIYAFFEAVMVNDEDAKVRQNRLRLLAGIRAALRPVADFDKISG